MENIQKAIDKITTVEDDVQDTRGHIQESLEHLKGLGPVFKDLKQVLTDARMGIEELNKERLTLKTERNKMSIEIEDLASERKKLEEEKKRKDETISALTADQKEILEKYHEIESQLKKFSTIAQDFEKGEFKFDDVKALLSIYVTLLEEIFQGQPHAKILYTVHGQKTEMSRDDIKKTTGISGAMVLRALHELAAAKLVEFDMDTNMVKLIRRIY
ncbi:MAG: hypothetical protein ACFFCS_01275 [Candidatus Hodarchaeota archaeon]